MRLMIGLTLLATFPVAAQPTPEAAQRDYGEAIKSSDWATAARMMHPGAIKQLRSLFEPILAFPEAEELGRKLFDLESPGALSTTPDTVFFAAFLKNSTNEQGLTEILKTSRTDPLGHIVQAGDTTLVVSRVTVETEGISISSFDVQPWVFENGRWWGLLKTDFTNMAAMLRKALAGPPPDPRR